MLDVKAHAEVVTGPVTEPVTIHEAKNHVALAASDRDHDSELWLAIQAAREQWEKDTQQFYVQRTMRLKLDCLDEFRFPHRPINAITSVTYFDSDNASQTLATSVYELDKQNSYFRLKYDQDFPDTATRWDAVTVNYTLGDSTDSTSVPAIAKQAMLLLIGYYFDANRGDNDRPHDQKAYERLVTKYTRSTYP